MMRFSHAFLLAALVAVACPAAAGEGASPSAERLVFLAEYVAADYGNAVHDGAVVDTFELAEMLRMTQELADGYQATAGGAASTAMNAELAHLAQLVRSRAPVEAVRSAARTLAHDLADGFHVAVHPPALPDLAHAADAFAQDCAPCHGFRGRGVGRVELDPQPTSFADPRVDLMSPHQLSAAIRFGIDGTAMPSFDGAYTAQQCWDLAFYVLTLHGRTPVRPEAATLSLEQLTASSRDELLSASGAGGPGPSAGEIDYLRAHPGEARGAPAGDDARALGLAVDLQSAFARVAERTLPGVVGVAAYVRDEQWTPAALATANGPGWVESHSEELLFPGFRRVRSGSGFVVDARGTVLTCDHLLRGPDRDLAALISLELPDGTHELAELVGSEPTVDLAVLRPGPFPDARRSMPPALPLGDAAAVSVGHWAIALGDPPGPDRSFEVGVVSAPAEQRCYQEQLSKTLMRTSLDVAPESFGGPIVDIHGAVFGMSVPDPRDRQAAEPGRSGYALPIGLARNLADALEVAHSTRSPWIGVSVLELSELRRRGHGDPDPLLSRSGIAIDNVFDPSPAASATIRPGDFLIAIEGVRIFSVLDFQKALYMYGIGGKVRFELLRGGKSYVVQLSIEERPAAAAPR